MILMASTLRANEDTWEFLEYLQIDDVVDIVNLANTSLRQVIIANF